MNGPGDVHFYPVIFLAGLYTVAAVCCLRPLPTWSPMPLWHQAPQVSSEATPKLRALPGLRGGATPAPAFIRSDDPTE